MRSAPAGWSTRSTSPVPWSRSASGAHGRRVSNDLRQVAAVVELSWHTLPIGVNLAGLVASAGGSINPVLAALLHNTSSIAVVANSARLVGHTPHLPSDAAAGLRAAPLEERRVR
ncbi:hypothetical protein ACIGPN_03970 [Streptomyces afghaniensis]|uniref:hypothetical protein n=1 Tax=Streptomyces TaxID=1883 RepID=UPI001FAFE348|nr:hypothetical protein [Streptomyces sp. HP-A2021]UOB14319.1 hypothetical protein MQE23_37035 [Streptomyces sp. HP-A2021]